MSSKRLVLVDTLSALFAFYYALPPLTNQLGEPTGALTGFERFIRKLMKEFSGAHLIFTIDSGRDTFRKALYDAYKANRSAMPEDLAKQLPYLKQLIEAWGFPYVKQPGYEADDIIGALTKQAEQQGFTEIIIATSDKDMAQLVSPCVWLYHPRKNETLDEAGILLKYGVRPNQMVDYLALVGDASDNIPGVPGVGEKTAKRLLASYSNIHEIQSHLALISPRVAKALKVYEDRLNLSHTLATICVDLPVSLSQLLESSLDEAKLEQDRKALYEILGFRFEVTSDEKLKPEVAPEVLELIQDPLAWVRFVESLKPSSQFCLHYSAPYQDQSAYLCIGFPDSGFVRLFLSALDDSPPASMQEAQKKWCTLCAPLLDKLQGAQIVTSNFKHLYHVLGDLLEGRKVSDVRVMAYVLNSSQSTELVDLIHRYLPHISSESSSSLDSGLKHSFALNEVLEQKLSDDQALKHYYETLEYPLVKLLYQMEFNGIQVDAQVLEAQNKTVTQMIEVLEKEAIELAGVSCNLSSPKQVAHLLFETMGLPVVQKTATGQYSTSEDVLRYLAREHKIADLILEYRHLSKLKSTYLEALPQAIAQDGRIHAKFHQTKVITGRLSSSEPNLQNIPVKTSLGRLVRKAFVAKEGYQLVSADYSQIELRLIAHFSGDPNLQKAFHEDLDIHRMTAAQIMNLSPDEITDSNRQKAKAVNFGIIYGISAFGLANQLGIEIAEAKSFMELYFERYPAVQAYIDQQVANAKQAGFVQTLLARKIFIADLKSAKAARRHYAERLAVNAPIQGSAAELIKKAMLQINTVILKQKFGSYVNILMQIHDELIFEVRSDWVQDFIQDVLIKEMESVYSLSVPLKVNVAFGNNWSEIH